MDASLCSKQSPRTTLFYNLTYTFSFHSGKDPTFKINMFWHYWHILPWNKFSLVITKLKSDKMPYTFVALRKNCSRQSQCVSLGQKPIILSEKVQNVPTLGAGTFCSFFLKRAHISILNDDYAFWRFLAFSKNGSSPYTPDRTGLNSNLSCTNMKKTAVWSVKNCFQYFTLCLLRNVFLNINLQRLWRSKSKHTSYMPHEEQEPVVSPITGAIYRTDNQLLKTRFTVFMTHKALEIALYNKIAFMNVQKIILLTSWQQEINLEVQNPDPKKPLQTFRDNRVFILYNIPRGAMLHTVVQHMYMYIVYMALHDC